MRAVATILVALAGAAHADTEILGHAGVTGSSSGVPGRSGGGAVAEIKGVVHEHVAVGGRVEIAVMLGGAIGDDDTTLDVAMAASGVLKAEVFATRGTVRPWVGFGFGAYTIGGQISEAGDGSAGVRQETGRYIGVAPQVGIDLGPVRLAATYNAILGAQLEVWQRVGDVMTTSTLSQNYLSLELSFRFAGGAAPRR